MFVHGFGLSLRNFISVVERIASVVEMQKRILTFVEYFNKTMAKPFQWTFKGKPLNA